MRGTISDVKISEDNKKGFIFYENIKTSPGQNGSPIFIYKNSNNEYEEYIQEVIKPINQPIHRDR